MLDLTHHEYVCRLSNGAQVVNNRIQGDSIDERDTLRPLTIAEAAELADIRFAEECAKDKAASLAQTDLW